MDDPRRDSRPVQPPCRHHRQGDKAIRKTGVVVDYEACKYIRMADGCSVDIYHWDIIVALAYRINTFYAHAFRKWLKETATREKDKEAHQAIIIPLRTFGNN